MAINHLLKFELSERPEWRERDAGCHNLKTSEMLKQIVEMRRRWLRLSAKILATSCRHIENKHGMIVKFIQHINIEEQVGTQDKDSTREQVLSILNPLSDSSESTDSNRRPSTIQELETQNLARAYLHLKSLHDDYVQEAVAAVDSSLDPALPPIGSAGSPTPDAAMNPLGLIEVEECVQKTNEILLKGLHGITGGVFSTSERVTLLAGSRWQRYPKFDSESDAENAVYSVIDRYNGLICQVQERHLNNQASENVELQLVTDTIKCAALLLIDLVSLHPFSDGNGRVVRLLSNYTLESALHAPFPTAIYNVFAKTSKRDFIKVIENTHILDKDGNLVDNHPPCELGAMLVESHWEAWRAFLKLYDIGWSCESDTEKLSELNQDAC